MMDAQATKRRVTEKDSFDNLMAWTYKYNLATYAKMPSENRMSWNLTAVLCTICNHRKYFYVCGLGKFTNGNDSYD